MKDNIFEKIRHKEQDENEYWMARELAAVIGYKDYRNFKGVIEKAQRLCKDNNANEADHFVECTELVEVGSGAKRPVPSFRLTRYACLLIAMCMNSKKNANSRSSTIFLGQAGSDERRKFIYKYRHCFLF